MSQELIFFSSIYQVTSKLYLLQQPIQEIHINLYVCIMFIIIYIVSIYLYIINRTLGNLIRLFQNDDVALPDISIDLDYYILTGIDAIIYPIRCTVNLYIYTHTLYIDNEPNVAIPRNPLYIHTSQSLTCECVIP